MLVWRNGEVLMKGKNRSIRLKKLRKNIAFKPILFSTPYITK